MTPRRWLIRRWRRLRRPTLGRLIVASLALHLGALTLTVVWLGDSAWTPRPRELAPLIVELPQAAPGRPVVRPETPTSESRPAAPPAVAARPGAPPAPAAPARVPAPLPEPAPPLPETVEPEPLPPARPPEPPPAARAAAPPPRLATPPLTRPAPQPEPPVVARREPPSRPPAARALEPPPAPLLPPPPQLSPARPRATPEPPPALRVEPPPAPAPPPPRVAAKPPELASPPALPALELSPPPEPTPRLGGEPDGGSPLSPQAFSLLRPELDRPPLPGPALPGGGGTQAEGEGQGEAGRELEGQVAIPLTTPDPRYTDYFLELKRRIEANLVYPREAARQNQSGRLLLEFVVKKDGSVRLVELVRSSGIEILDQYSVNTVRLSAPFPPIPERMGVDSIFISASFTYVLDRGFRLFGLR